MDAIWFDAGAASIQARDLFPRMSASPPPAKALAGRSSRVPVLAAASFATSTQTFVVSGLLMALTARLSAGHHEK